MNTRKIALALIAAVAALIPSLSDARAFAGGKGGGESRPSGLKAYVTNSNTDTVAVVDILSRVAIGEIPVGGRPQHAAKSPDNQFVYVANSDSQNISVISTETDTVVGTVDVSFPEPYDVVVSPDGATVYAVERNSAIGSITGTGDSSTVGHSVVSVIDVATLTETSTIHIATKTFDPKSEGLALTPDGAFLFVMNTNDFSVSKIDTSTLQVVANQFTDVDFPRRAKVTADGTTLVVIGDGNTPQYLSVSDLSDQGSENSSSQNELVMVDNFAYATENFGGVLGINALGHSISFDASLDPITTPDGIDVTPDHTTLWIADDEIDELFSVEIGKGLGIVGESVPFPGSGSHRSVVIVAATNTNVGQFLLPHAVRADLHNNGHDHLYFHGNYNDAGAAVNLHAPVTIQIGGFSRTVTLTERQFGKFFSFLDGTMHLVVTPKVHGSSRGIIQCTLRNTNLGGLVNTNGTLSLHFHASGIPDAPATVVMDSGNYRIGRAPGLLINPSLSLKNARIKSGQLAPDKLQLRAGFTGNGTAPGSLGTVSVSLGSMLNRTIPGSQFKHLGDRYRFVESTPSSYLWITIDFKREVILIGSVGNTLGDLSGIQNFTMNWGAGLGSFTIPVVFAQVERELFF